LRSRVNNKVRPLLLHEIADALPVANIYVLVAVARHSTEKTLHLSQRGTLRPEELLPHVVVNSNNFPSLFRQ
jgi:hypothetical protein